MGAGADVHGPASEGAGGEHHRTRAEASTFDGFHAGHLASIGIEKQPRHHALYRDQVGLRLQQLTHGPPIEPAITLCTRGPHRRSLAAVEHPELHGGHIGGARHDPPQRVHFADHGAFGDTANGGVAGELSDLLQRSGDQRHRGTGARRRHRGLRAGVSGADHDHVEGRLHGGGGQWQSVGW